MTVTLLELQRLRLALSNHRIEHKKLVSEMHTLRKNCREMRQQIARSAAARRAGLTHAVPAHRRPDESTPAATDYSALLVSGVA
ncbi:MAG: hypothetical protein AAGB00_08810 [Planctomycetota bacterium]